MTIENELAYYKMLLKKAQRIQNVDELNDLLQESGLKFTYTSKQQLIEYFKDEITERQ